MVNFNIIDTAGLAYQTIWRERAYLFRLGVFPLLIKLACFTFALSAGWESNVLRLTICLVPACLAEGWMIAHVVRLIGLSQRWPFQPSGNMAEDVAHINVRARGVIGGAVAYALINLLIGGYMHILTGLIPVNVAPEEVNSQNAMIGILMLVFSVVGFRYIWVHIPLSLNIPLRQIMLFLSNRGLNLKFIGVWAMCFMPPMIAMLILASVFVGQDMEFMLVVLRVIFDTLKVLTCTAGITLTFITLTKIRRT